MTGFPTVRTADRGRASRALRTWSIAALVVGIVLSGTALAVAGSAKKKSNEYGSMGVSPVPIATEVHGKTKFNVASFNILGWDHTLPGNRRGFADGRKRMRWAIQLLKAHKVDVVGLQEFQPQQYNMWTRKASDLYDIYPGYTETVGYLRNSIAWRKDKFRLVSTTWLKIPYFHGDVLRMPVVLLQSLKTGQQFYVMNFQNPADVRGNAAKWRRIGQRMQIALVNQLRANNNLPIIWTGDFNARRQAFCRVTKQAGMIAANGGARTDTSCTPPKRMLVDWIFGSGLKFKKYAQIRNRKVARTSDHHLLTARAVLFPAAATILLPDCATVTAMVTVTSDPTGTPTQSESVDPRVAVGRLTKPLKPILTCTHTAFATVTSTPTSTATSLP